MVRVAELFALQEIDTELDGLEFSLAEIRNRPTENQDLIIARARLDELHEATRGLATEQREAEANVEDIRAKVTTVEEKLYGGSITNSKELRDLQRELESIQRQQRAREEELLAVLSRSDEANVEMQSLQRTITEGQAAWDSGAIEAEQRGAALEQQISALQVRRALAVRPIDGESLSLYNRLRKMRGGRAVARVQRGACLGCRIVLPSNLFQKARSGNAVVQCSSCERILYVG